MFDIKELKELIEFANKNNIVIDLHIGSVEKFITVGNDKKCFYIHLNDIDGLSYAKNLTYWINKSVEEMKKE